MMGTLKTMTIEQLLGKIGEAKNIDRLKDLKPIIQDELSVLGEWDFSGEIVHKMYHFAMGILIKDPSLMQHLNFKAAAGDGKKPMAVFEVPVMYGPKMRLKSWAEIIEDNPDYIKNRIDDNVRNFYDNGKYFFQQADVPKMLEVFKNPQVWEAINKAGYDLKKSVKALQRFNMCYHDAQANDKQIEALTQEFPIES